MVRLCDKSGRILFHLFLLFCYSFTVLMILLKEESIKSLPSTASLKNSSSDSGSDLNTAIRPRAIDNSCLVATSTIKVIS